MQNTRINKILTILKKNYSEAKIALKYSNNWELLVAVILSAQCTDKKVNEVTSRLFAKYKTLDDYIKADINKFEQDIRSTGFYHNKAKNILGSAKLIKESFDGKVPQRMEEILALPGVARKTANVVLGNAYHIIKGIAVDTHVHRISQRLRLVSLDRIGGKKIIIIKQRGKEIIDFVKDADPNRVEQELMKNISKKYWFNLTYMIIDHGRAICKSQNPKCGSCQLSVICPVSRAI